MPLTLTVNGVDFAYPRSRETGWGTDATAWAQAVTNGMLSKAGGTFTLTADVNFGATFGLLASYFSGRSLAAQSGLFRLENASKVAWRNQAGTADLSLGVNTSNQLTFEGTLLAVAASLPLTAGRAVITDGSGLISTSSVTSGEVSRLAGVTSNIQTQLDSKITAGTSSIVNNDVNALAGIALSKLAAVTASRALVSNGSGFISASSVTDTELGYVSGVTSAIQTQINAKQNTLAVSDTTTVDLTLAADNLSADVIDGSLTDVKINASAAIALSKLAAVTASRALVSDGSGFVSASGVTATELGYVSGVTSGIQAQIDALSGGGGLVPLAEYTPSAATSVDITSVIDGTYDTYLLTFSLIQSTDGTGGFLLRTSVNNGSSFSSGASDYSDQLWYALGSATDDSAGDSSQSAITLTLAPGSGTGENFCGVALLFTGSAARFPAVVTLGTSDRTDNFVSASVTAGRRLSAATIDAVQILHNAANMTGVIRIYGLGAP